MSQWHHIQPGCPRLRLVVQRPVNALVVWSELTLTLIAIIAHSCGDSPFKYGVNADLYQEPHHHHPVAVLPLSGHKYQQPLSPAYYGLPSNNEEVLIKNGDEANVLFASGHKNSDPLLTSDSIVTKKAGNTNRNQLDDKNRSNAISVPANDSNATESGSIQLTAIRKRPLSVFGAKITTPTSTEATRTLSKPQTTQSTLITTTFTPTTTTKPRFYRKVIRRVFKSGVRDTNINRDHDQVVAQDLPQITHRDGRERTEKTLKLVKTRIVVKA